MIVDLQQDTGLRGQNVNLHYPSNVKRELLDRHREPCRYASDGVIQVGSPDRALDNPAAWQANPDALGRVLWHGVLSVNASAPPVY